MCSTQWIDECMLLPQVSPPSQDTDIERPPQPREDRIARDKPLWMASPGTTPFFSKVESFSAPCGFSHPRERETQALGV